jgi:hypothetical protein
VFVDAGAAGDEFFLQPVVIAIAKNTTNTVTKTIIFFINTSTSIEI